MCWLSTAPIAESLPSPSKPVQFQHTLTAQLLIPSQITDSSSDQQTSREKAPVEKGMEDDPVFVIFMVLREVYSTSQQSSSSKQTLEKIQGPVNFAVRCLCKDGVQSSALDQTKPFMPW